jgi:ParD-like antitoxin of type II bacterial toxin-antitoxin system
MPQPVKLSDALVEDARETGDVAERSIASQIEHWARLGRAVEAVLRGDEVLALKKSRGAIPLSSCLDADSPAGHLRFHAHMDARPFPRYERANEAPGMFARVDRDGTRTLGRLVGRTFEPA